MRVIGSIQNDAMAQQFSAFLTGQEIDNRCEATLDSATGQISSQIWVADEDRIEEANEFLLRFMENPEDPLFRMTVPVSSADAPEEEEEDAPASSRRVSVITIFFLAVCVFVYLLNLVEESNLSYTHASQYVMTPVQKSLLFDLPPVIDRYEAFIAEHPIAPDQKITDLPPDVLQKLDVIQQTPYWRGAYDWVVLKIKTGDASEAEGPLFTKIREGEIWRLFTPCVLHRDLLHILFNMIWLWVLGRPIEQRIGWWRTLILTLVVGVAANTVQYLMSGPLFLGYSGIVMGLAGFIWMRERISPWEGYPLPRATILFLVFFVLAMFVLQALSFFVQISSDLPFVLSIANSAHIAGAILGALLGRLSFFAWRVK